MPDAPMAPNSGLTFYEPLASVAGFDPVNNKDHEEILKKHVIPASVDLTRDTAWAAHWADLFSTPPRIVPAEFRSVDFKATPLAAPSLDRPQAGRRRGLARVCQTSPNWSGGYVVPEDGGHVTGVIGQWTVPAVQPGVAYPGNTLPHRCSIWVGVDGKFQWADSMPQIGTEHTVSGQEPRSDHKAWIQWWRRRGGTVPVYADAITLGPGDTVSCGLVLDETLGAATFHMKNHATGLMIVVRACTGHPARGSSAEWIVERPADTPNAWNKDRVEPRYLHPLPDHGRVTLERFSVARSVRAAVGMERARLVSMTEVRPYPVRDVVISGAWRENGKVSVEYWGSGGT